MKTNKLLIWLWLVWGVYLLILQTAYLLASSPTIHHFSGFWIAFSLAAFINAFGLYSEKKWSRPLTLLLSVILVINTILTLHYVLLLGAIPNLTRAAQIVAFILKITVAVYSLTIVFFNGRRTA